MNTNPREADGDRLIDARSTCCSAPTSPVSVVPDDWIHARSPSPCMSRTGTVRSRVTRNRLRTQLGASVGYFCCHLPIAHRLERIAVRVERRLDWKQKLLTFSYAVSSSYVSHSYRIWIP
jgi:hypothetical protein